MDRREIWRPPSVTTDDQQLLPEEEILSDYNSGATAAEEPGTSRQETGQQD